MKPSTGESRSGACNNRTSQSYGGFQVGGDFSRLNVGDFNIHFGATAGYVETSGGSRTANSTNNNSGGDIRADFQVPFVGIYGVVTKGTAFADFQARWDFFQGQGSNRTFGLSNQPVNAQAFTLIGNLGQQYQLPDNWFVEPSAGVVYTQVGLNSFSGFGSVDTLYSQVPGAASRFAPFTSKTQDFDSILSRASIRVGRNFVVEGYVLQPFVTASIYHEFAGDIRTISFSELGNSTGYLGTGQQRPGDTVSAITTKRIGTFGQVAIGLAGQITNTGWQGYVRGDYRIGDHVQGYGISGGFRYSFTPETVAQAIISKDAPGLLQPATGPVIWSGLSVGASAGANWEHTRQVFPTVGNPAVPTFPQAFFVPTSTPIYPFSLSNRRSTNPLAAGAIAGGQIAVNYQMGRIVIGVEGDGNWTNARGGRSCPNAVYYSCETGVDLLAFVTGRVGYAWDRTLFYAKGGVAFGDVSDGFRQNNIVGLPLLTYTTLGASTSRASLVGWAAGAGFEYALSDHWSAKAEYLHYDLGDRRSAFQPQNIAFDATHTGDLVRVGVNYRFSFDPIIARVPSPVIAKY
ncbi:autotransporter domain-containing protein [Methylobacterium sp. WL7]|uniref:autotransporter domain-containing protein n=1 Tax=Methylobacterium sp. WL7 TaxID=2603900 RepID=UPI001FEDF957|nr:autotransporter domain-containing protein [Methylobacterium sp. WL7]